MHGRILQLEQHMYPLPRWLLAIRFDTLEHNGVEQPLVLISQDGRGTFVFEQQREHRDRPEFPLLNGRRAERISFLRSPRPPYK